MRHPCIVRQERRMKLNTSRLTRLDMPVPAMFNGMGYVFPGTPETIPMNCIFKGARGADMLSVNTLDALI